jgi:hypothetical protein
MKVRPCFFASIRPVAKAIKNDFSGIASMIGSNGRSGWNLILLRLAKQSCQTVLLINTRLQPGVGSPPASEPFQRLAGAGKTVETVLTGLAGHHRAEARC